MASSSSLRALALSAVVACAACDGSKAIPHATVDDAVLRDPVYGAHVSALQRKLGKAFTIVVEAPFVIIGDESPKKLRERAATIRWATDKLKADYFSKDPLSTIDVYLFKSQASYLDNALAFFGERPSTPYGYYSAANRALIMNISTGEGTLVHEMVHPFIEANFPDCPPWFNEGLASLYERPGEEDGRIIGDTNWRLPILQKAIAEKRTKPFAALLNLDAGSFYGDEQGTNYAEARYLVYYLQMRGMLPRFYREMVASHERDPSGYETLKSVLGETDMEAFQGHWEAFVSKLRFP